jgi:hypothetical protein
VGKGRFLYTLVHASGARSERLRAAATAFNGRGKTLLLYVKPRRGSPVTVRFKVTRGGRLLRFQIHPVYRVINPISFESIELRLGKARTRAGRKRHYVSNPRVCNAGFPWRVDLTFEAGEAPLQDLAPCRG